MRRVTRRPLSVEERRIWAEVLRSVQPLAGRSPIPADPDPPGDKPADPAPMAAQPAIGPPKPAAPPPRPPLAPLEKRLVRALARGRAGADSTLDLHGSTQAEAHARLLGFLRRAQASGHSLVLVITGRGASSGSPGERGILRRVVPHWLSLPEMRPLVLGFEEAGPRQGGAGALYVRLRRSRSSGR